MQGSSFFSRYFKFFLPLVLSMPFFLVPSFVRDEWLGGVLFLVGLYLGTAFLVLDEKWLNQFYAENNSVVQKKLITRSTLFLLIMIPLTIFVLTSSGSLLGSGMILGIQLGVVEELWRFWKIDASGEVVGDVGNQPLAFQTRFFHDLQIKLNQKDVRYIAVSATIFLLISSVLVII